MLETVLFEDASGQCPVQEFMHDLAAKAKESKDAKIQLQAIKHGVRVAENVEHPIADGSIKPIHGKLWEIVAGVNRVFFFRWKKQVVLLHCYRKKSGKAPKKEILRAEKEMNSWIDSY